MGIPDLRRSYCSIVGCHFMTELVPSLIHPSIRAGRRIKITDTKINDVFVKVSHLDYIDPDYHLRIEHRETSPDGKYELIAYWYLKDDHNLNFIHISVIPQGESSSYSP